MDFLLDLVDRAIAAEHVLVVGSTSHPDTLRRAFTQPGRLERVVEVSPTYPERHRRGAAASTPPTPRSARAARCSSRSTGSRSWRACRSARCRATGCTSCTRCCAARRAARPRGEAVSRRSPRDDFREEAERFQKASSRLATPTGNLRLGRRMETWLVTGGAGFIGCNFVRLALAKTRRAHRRARQAHLRRQPREPRRRRRRPPLRVRARRHRRSRGGRRGLPRAPADARCSTSRPRRTSTARSTSPARFVRTNVVGTFELLEAARRQLAGADRRRARALPLPARLDRRGLRLARRRPAPSARRRPTSRTRPTPPRRPAPTTSCAPITPPTALPALITNCSNNYGPYQFPEKLIPLMILNALEGEAAADLRRRPQRARLALRRGPLRGRSCSRSSAGGPARSTTSAASASARTSRSSTRCARELERHPSRPPRTPRSRARASPRYADLKRFVTDRPGHDRRYAIDSARAQTSSAGAPRTTSRRPRGDRAVVPRPPRLVRGGAVGPLPARAARAAQGSTLRGGMP